MKYLLSCTLSFFLLTTLFSQNPEQIGFYKEGTLDSRFVTDTIPIEIWNDLVLIKAKVNNIEGTFIWDNGFSITALDSVFLSKNKIVLDENLSTISGTDGNNQQVNFYPLLIDEINIGKAIVKNTYVTQINVNSISHSNRKIDGILGGSIINKLNWSFNFDENYVVVSKYPFIKEGKKLNIELTDWNTHLIKCTLNGYDVGLALIDFGDNGDNFTITIDASSLFPQSKAIEKRGLSAMSVGGRGTIDTSYIITGGYTYSLSGEIFDFTPKIEFTNKDDAMTIGNRFFRRYNVIINPQQGNYILTKRETKLEEFPKKSYGLMLAKTNNEIIVAYTISNPNLTNKSINPLDKVIKVDDKEVTFFEDFVALKKYQQDALKKGKKLKITFFNGTEYEFKPMMNIEKF